MHGIKTENLIKIYRTRRVVNEVSLEINKSEVVGLLGPNGAGKTTTFYMIVGLINPDKGKISFKGNDITNEPMFKRSGWVSGILRRNRRYFAS